MDDETSTVRQPQYASTSLSTCRTFLALRQRARFRWLNQLLLLSAFPVRIFHLDTDLSRYFALLHSREWISPTTFIYFHPSMSLLLHSFLRPRCRVNDSKIFFYRVKWHLKIYQRWVTMGKILRIKLKSECRTIIVNCNDDRSYTKSG